HLARCFTPGDALRVGREDGQVAVPPRRQLAPLHLLHLGRERGILPSVSLEELCPAASGFRTSLADASGKVLVNTVRHQELRVLGPAVGLLRQVDLVLAEWFPVSR